MRVFISALAAAPYLSRKLGSRHSHDVPAKDLLNIRIGNAALYHAYGKHRPIRPREARVRCVVESSNGPQRLVARTRFRPAPRLATFDVSTARRVGNIGTDRDVVRTKALHEVLDMVQHRVQVTATAEKRRDCVHADVAATIRDPADHVVGFGADVMVNRHRAAVARDNWLSRSLGGFEAGAPS